MTPPVVQRARELFWQHIADAAEVGVKELRGSGVSEAGVTMFLDILFEDAEEMSEEALGA